MPAMEIVTTVAQGASLLTVPGQLTVATAGREAAAMDARSLRMVFAMMVASGVRTPHARLVLTVQTAGRASATTAALTPTMVTVMMAGPGANMLSVRSAQTVPTAECERCATRFKSLVPRPYSHKAWASFRR